MAEQILANFFSRNFSESFLVAKYAILEAISKSWFSRNIKQIFMDIFIQEIQFFSGKLCSVTSNKAVANDFSIIINFMR